MISMNLVLTGGWSVPHHGRIKPLISGLLLPCLSIVHNRNRSLITRVAQRFCYVAWLKNFPKRNV